MRLADDTVVVAIGRETLTLRASLRAGTRLIREYGDYGVILRAVANGELGVIARVIEETSIHPTSVPRIIEEIASGPLRHGLEAVIPAAADIVLKLANVDGDDPDVSEQSTGPRLTLDEFHTALFRIGTGWLGWSPEAVWRATAPEIIEAHKGRVELLTAMFGGEASTDKPKSKPDLTRDEDATAVLKALAA